MSKKGKSGFFQEGEGGGGEAEDFLKVIHSC